jgi:hypothetical protein
MKMRLFVFAGTVTALLLPAVVSAAETSPIEPQVGDTYEIALAKQTTQHGSNGSSGSTEDDDKIIERVINVRANGLELEYDLPNTSTANERASNWQFPARIFKPLSGSLQLLNGPELEARLDGWLKVTKLPRTSCGHWIFTWNAFRIECDPQSVIKTVDAFDLKAAGIREGALYLEPDTQSSGTISRKAAGPEGAILTVEVPVDSDAFHRARAEADVVTGEILRKPVTFDAALRERTKETVSGITSVVFEANSSGTVYRRTKTTKLDIKSPNGQSETETIVETLERRLVSQSH